MGQQAIPDTAQQDIKLSIVSPVYRAEMLVEMLVDRIRQAVIPMQCSYEIILVEDGSPDQSW